MEKKKLKPKKVAKKIPLDKAKKPGRIPAKAIVAKEEKQELPVRGISLSNLHAPKGAHKHRKIKGRGSSSGHGKTSTRGSKGQTSRSGRDFYLGFEGGQTPLIRRIPKRGFTNKFKKEYQVINLRDLSRIKESTITLELLEERGLIKNKQRLVKILGEGKIQNPVTIQAHAFSKKAAQDIKNAGGKPEIISEDITYGAEAT